MAQAGIETAIANPKTVIKQQFLTTKRVALWRAHNMRCIYCYEPLRFTELWIEHILPEYLLTKPDELTKVLAEYGLETDFDLNGYGNLLPCHAHCNRKKGVTIFETRAAHFYLAIAGREASKAKKEEERAINNQEADRILSELGIAIESGLVTKDQVDAITHSFGNSNLNLLLAASEPIVITFGVNVHHVLSSGLLPAGVPSNYVGLCDWLEQDLITLLTSKKIGTFYYPEASERSGETLSIRLAFPHFNMNVLDGFESPWWDILEIAYYSEIYGTDDWAGWFEELQ